MTNEKEKHKGNCINPNVVSDESSSDIQSVSDGDSSDIQSVSNEPSTFVNRLAAYVMIKNIDYENSMRIYVHYAHRIFHEPNF